jgi:hypothetical protein
LVVGEKAAWKWSESAWNICDAQELVKAVRMPDADVS